jgi:hypothetical protein
MVSARPTECIAAAGDQTHNLRSSGHINPGSTAKVSDNRSTQDSLGGDTVKTTNPSDHIVDPTIRALETYIEASAEMLLQGDDTANRHGLLVLSSWHESMPALVHLDPILEPVDSRVFSILWIWARQHGRGATAFPSYDYLLQRSNIQGRAMLSRALTILRITRWITLCRRVRDPAGRNRGNIYALHEEPLALVNTLYLDPNYMDFLHAATRHHHDQVRHLARARLESLQTRIDGGEDVLDASPLTPIDQRIEAIETIAGEGTGNYFGFHLKTLASLQDWRWRSKIAQPGFRTPIREPSSEFEPGPSSEFELGLSSKSEPCLIM